MKTKLELIDLGDARRETKQFMQIFFVPDSAFFLGLFPDF